MWDAIIVFLSNPVAPYVFCGVLIFVFIAALADSYARLVGINHATGRAITTLETAANAGQLFLEFENLSDRFTKQGRFSGPWAEFSKTVILDTDRSLVRMARRPLEFFNSNSLIAPYLNLRQFAAMPGYLISLGLFFTFIGLVAAIAIAAQGLGQQASIEATQAALVQLLDVASLKFISSVAGISLSILLSFAQKSMLNRTQQRIHRFCSALEARTQLITTEQLLHEWLLAQQQLSRGQMHLAEDIATEVTLQLSQSKS